MCQHEPHTAADERRFEQILAWLESGTRTPDLDELEASDPERFAASVELARRLLDHLDATRLKPLTDGQRRRALGVLRSERRTGWRTILAQLLPQGNAVPALRSGFESTRLLFGAEDYDVDLGLIESGALMGQVLGPESEIELGPDAELGFVLLEDSEGDETLREAPLDRQGIFRFGAPVPAVCRLTLTFGEVRLVLDRVVLREA